jgi:hypothetical protein
MVSRKNSWNVVDRGVNGQPFIWKTRSGGKYVMIDIFHARPKGCYAVVTLNCNPLITRNCRGRLVGLGCADGPSGWVGAYVEARRIALKYMDEHSQ